MDQRTRRTQRLALGGLAVLALLLAAPADAQSKRSEQLLSDRPPPRRGCGVSARPRPLPGLAQLADSARLAAAVAAYAAEFPVRDGRTFALYSIVFDKGGRVERVAPIEYFLPEARAEMLQQLVRESLRVQPSGGWSVRLRVEPGAEPVLRVGHSEWCPPRSRTAFSVVAPAAYPVASPQPLRLRLRIGADGHVALAEVLSSTGSPGLDHVVQQRLQDRRFEPALLDGVPVAADHEETVRIRKR